MKPKLPLSIALSPCLVIPLLLHGIKLTSGCATREARSVALGPVKEPPVPDTSLSHSLQSFRNGRVAGSERVDGEGTSQIFTFAPDGSDRKQLTTSGSNIIPSWSRDGKRILFTCNNEIFEMKVDGTGKRQLTFNTPGGNITPVESPDGKHIAFSAIRGNNRAEIWVMNADGTNPRQLTMTPRISPLLVHKEAQGPAYFETLPPKMRIMQKELPRWLQNPDHQDRAPEANSLVK